MSSCYLPVDLCRAKREQDKVRPTATDESDGERKRRRGENYALSFDNRTSWYVIEDLRDEQDRV